MAISGDKRTTPLLMILLAGIIGYAFWSGSLIDMLGLKGVQQQKEQLAAIADTVATLNVVLKHEDDIEKARANLAQIAQG